MPLGLSVGCYGDNMQKPESGEFILSFITFRSTVYPPQIKGDPFRTLPVAENSLSGYGGRLEHDFVELTWTTWLKSWVDLPLYPVATKISGSEKNILLFEIMVYSNNSSLSLEKLWQ